MGVRNLLVAFGSTPSYRPVLEVHGWRDVNLSSNRLSKADQGSMVGLVTDEMVRTIAGARFPDEVAAEIVPVRRLRQVAPTSPF